MAISQRRSNKRTRDEVADDDEDAANEEQNDKADTTKIFKTLSKRLKNSEAIDEELKQTYEQFTTER